MCKGELDGTHFKKGPIGVAWGLFLGKAQRGTPFTQRANELRPSFATMNIGLR